MERTASKFRKKTAKTRASPGRYLRRALLAVLLLLFGCFLLAQEGQFPDSWTGHWEGQLEIYSPEGKIQEIPMQLLVEPLDSAYTWTIIYGADEEAGRRPYLLKPVRPELGLYAIDEQNTIVLEATYVGGKLYCRFEVGGSLLLSTVERQGDVLLYEIVSGKLEARSTSGGQTFEGEEIPEVQSMPVVVRQAARLRRK